MTDGRGNVAVVGGGVLGSAIAYWLARSKVPVTLIERDEFSSHASGKNAGNLNPIFMAPPAMIPLALASFDLHKSLATELAQLNCPSYQIEPVRRLLLAFDAAEEAQLGNVMRLFTDRPGFSTQILDAEGILEMEPRIAAGVRAGLLMEGNLSLDSAALNLALVEGARRHGAVVIREGVTGINAKSDSISGVRTKSGVVDCSAVVFAIGPWIEQLERWTGFSLPVRPVKGELLRMRLLSGGMQYDLTRGSVSLYRRGHDEVWVGVTQDEAGFDAAPTNTAKEYLLRAGTSIMPGIANAELLEHCAALRPVTPSGLPIVGRLPGWKNAYCANGGGSKGVLLCTGIAQGVHDLMLSGRTRFASSFHVH